MGKGGITTVHGHGIGFQPGCAECLAVRKEQRAKARADATLRRQRNTASKRRARQRDPFARSNVVGLPRNTHATQAPSGALNGVGDNEFAVRQQCENSPRAEEKPGTVAQAITLAKMLDDPRCLAMWPTTSRQLHALLTSLDSPKRKTNRGRLAVVQAMVAPKGRAQSE